MTIELLDLPPELVVKILDNLSAVEVGRCSQTCSNLKEICATELIWQKLCHQVDSDLNCDKWEATYYEIYTKVLHRYGQCLGLWRRKMSWYGGLVHVEVKDGHIVGSEIKAPLVSNIHGPLRKKTIFSIGINKTKKTTEVLCHGGYGLPHPGEIKFDEEGVDFVFQCKQLSSHTHPGGDNADYEEVIREETDNGRTPFTIYDQRRLEQYRANMGEYKLIRMEVQPPNPVYPIQPGIFFAHYSVHGNEMFLLSYDLDKMEASITKITGDPNVPSGEISIFVNLRKPLRLSREEQLHPEQFNAEWEESIPNSDKIEPYDQEFVIPPHFQAFFGGDFNPTRCKYRCLSKGRVAGTGYTNPALTNGIFSVLSEDTFCNLWSDIFMSRGQIANVGFHNPSSTSGQIAVVGDNYFIGIWLMFERAYLYIRMDNEE